MTDFAKLRGRFGRKALSISALIMALLLLLMPLSGCYEGIYEPYQMDPGEDLSAPAEEAEKYDEPLNEDMISFTDAEQDEVESPEKTAPTTVETTAATTAQTTVTTTTTAATTVTETTTTTSKPTEKTTKKTKKTTTTTRPTTTAAAAIDEDGYYYSKDDVALYIYTYGHLPDNFITKKKAQELGWNGGSLERYKKGFAIGGDRFGNYEGILPKKSGRVYTECDIDTKGKNSRGAKRIVFSNDGLIFYTGDHYETFTQIYP